MPSFFLCRYQQKGSGFRLQKRRLMPSLTSKRGSAPMSCRRKSKNTQGTIRTSWGFWSGGSFAAHYAGACLCWDAGEAYRFPIWYVLCWWHGSMLCGARSGTAEWKSRFEVDRSTFIPETGGQHVLEPTQKRPAGCLCRGYSDSGRIQTQCLFTA